MKPQKLSIEQLLQRFGNTPIEQLHTTTCQLLTYSTFSRTLAQKLSEAKSNLISFFDYYSSIEPNQKTERPTLRLMSASVIQEMAPELFADDFVINEPFDVFHIDGDTIFHAILPRVRDFTIPLCVLDRTITRDLYFGIRNEEYKSAIIEYLVATDSLQWFMDNVLGAEKIDTFVDKKQLERIKNPNSMTVGVYTLYKAKDTITTLAYVQCYCPSTDRVFYLQCDPKYNNAKDALASLLRPPKCIMPYIKEISRQGEVFLLYIDNEHLDTVETLLRNKNNRQDVESVTGDWYFDKMVYEY
jgi:hypothetical protein